MYNENSYSQRIFVGQGFSVFKNYIYRTNYLLNLYFFKFTRIVDCVAHDVERKRNSTVYFAL